LLKFCNEVFLSLGQQILVQGGVSSQSVSYKIKVML